MPELPTGTVTFLFTDIEGSTRLWEEKPGAMRTALARHNSLVAGAVESAGGYVFKAVGDAFYACFARADDAVSAASAAQRSFHSEQWPEGVEIKVRMALHTGLVEQEGGDYFGQPLNRIARLLSTGHGGQVLISAATQELVRDSLPSETSLRDCGEHRLKDLGRPESVFQLCHPDLLADFPPLRSLEGLPNNLPVQVTSFIGREKELGEIAKLFEKTRLLTLTGSGGCGKTRLALQAAAGMLDGSGDGVWLVELASISDPVLVPQTVASVLGLKEVAGKSIVQTLLDYLKSRHLVIVLDNCEHLLPACATLANSILRSCPGVLVLATSREGLGIAGETTYRVPSLSSPDPKVSQTPESLSHFEAVRLFIDRSEQVSPGFRVTNRNAPALASICHRLDGIPLAIELAAARTRSLSVEEVNQRLDQRFRLLTGGSRTALPRQQTLRSLIDWSYDLLNEAERALLCRLSVFAGGWTIESAERVCAGEPVEDWEVLDLLTSLVDKSLVVAEQKSETTRYRLLETVRQYARDRLMEGGEGEVWRGKHLMYFVSLAEEAGPHLQGAEQQRWLERLEVEHDNVRAALAWSSEDGAVDSGLRLAGALWRFWEVRGYLGEGRNWLAGLLAVECETDPAVRAKALNGSGALAYGQGDYGVACTLYEESLVIQRELGDRGGIAWSLNGMGTVAFEQGDYAAARVLVEESLVVRRELGDRAGIAWSLNGMGTVAQEQGEYMAARALYEESLAIMRELGDRGGIANSLNNMGLVACVHGDYTAARTLLEESLAIRRELGGRLGISNSLNGLGSVAYGQGDFASARALYEESLAIRRELGDRRGIAESLEGLAAACAASGNARRGAILWGAAELLREEIGLPHQSSERPRYEHNVAAARVALSDDVLDAAWQEGRAMTMEQAIELALEKSNG